MALSFELDPLYEKISSGELEGDMAEMAKSASPLCLAMSLSPRSVVAYPHTKLLDAYLVALVHMQLYRDGPGPPPDVWVRDREGRGSWRLAGNGLEVALSDEVFLCDEKRYVRPGTGVDAGIEDQVVFNLGVVEPPRHGKSFLVTEHLPLWFLTLYPIAAVLLATYSQDFAEKWGSALKDKLDSQGDLLPLASDGLPLKARNSTNANTSFRPGKDQGEINYRGVGGAITGTGYTLGLIDDPFKGAEDALSEAERTNKSDWYMSVFNNRQTPVKGLPPPMQVNMATRWHEGDLHGVYVLEEDGETPKPGWCMLRLPALAEPGGDDPLNRMEGESLCPQMASLSFLEQQLSTDPVWFSCLFQGAPSHAQGNTFKKTYEPPNGGKASYHHYRYNAILERYDGPNDQYVNAKDPDTEHFMTIDTATSKRTKADWTVFSHWAFNPWVDRLILVDRFRDRISTSEYVDELDKFLETLVIQPTVIAIENKTFGTSFVNELRRDRPHLVLFPLKADRDKIARAAAYARGVGAGKVWFPDPLWVAWGVKWENEHAGFPRTTHDDQVDTGGYAYEYSRALLRPGESSPDSEPEALPEVTHVDRGMAQIRRGQGRSVHPYTRALEAASAAGFRR